MKRALGTLSVVFALCWSMAVAGDRVEKYTRDYTDALRHGAKGRVTFRVVDEIGNMVAGASMKVSFVKPGSQWIYGSTDTNGLYNVEDRLWGTILYRVSQGGYYGTDGEYNFGVGNIMLEGGKWVPWDSTNTVTLKRVRQPVPMFACEAQFCIPVTGTNVGFDFEKRDWVPPYGNGQHQDMIVKFEEHSTSPWLGFRKLEMSFGTNTLDGVRIFKQDRFSHFRSLHEAPEDGYEKSVRWSLELTGKEDIITGPSPDDYLVFRVRTEVDENGKIAKANYGKIYGPVGYETTNSFRLVYYFNPDVNSRNIEFDRNRNLFGRWHGGLKDAWKDIRGP